MTGVITSGFAIEEATIADIHAAYREGRATAVGVTQAHLDRIAAYDRKGPALGAVIVTNSQAPTDAAALDAQLQKTGRMAATTRAAGACPTSRTRTARTPARPATTWPPTGSKKSLTHDIHALVLGRAQTGIQAFG